MTTGLTTTTQPITYGTSEEKSNNSSTSELLQNDLNIQNLPSKSSNPSEPKVHTYGSFVAYCFCVNYILGVGVLGVPYGFAKGGLLIGPLFLLVVTVFASFVTNWIIETICRSGPFFKELELEKLKKEEERKTLLDHQNDSPKTEDDIDNNSINNNEPLQGEENRIQETTQEDELIHSFNNNNKGIDLFQYPTKRYEINELCRLFLGIPGKIIYEVALCLYLYGGLWSYAAVFAESMASHVPLPISGWFTCNVYTDTSVTCDILYKIYIGIYAIIVIPLTCLNLTEQKPLQIFLTIFRYVALALMIVTIFVSIFVDPYSRYPENPHFAMERHPPYVSPTSLALPSGFYILLPICIYSQILHHSVPGLCEPVKNKKHLPGIFTSTFITTLLFYCLLGIVLAVYYGDNIQATCSLNFSFYRGGKPFGISAPWWADIIIYLIILFPAIDVLSAFPLNGITLGNNMHAAFFSGTKWMENRKIQVAFRILAAVPPIIGGCFVKNLDSILKYVGILGFLITFVFPPLLHLVSAYKARKKYGTDKTPFTYPFISSTATSVICILFGIAAILYCIIANIVYAVLDSENK
ncbi:hypothetical protein ABK040_015680 [Willaertia magna]